MAVTAAASRPRRRVLAVTSELPWPLDSGGHLRTFHVLRCLAKAFDIRLITSDSHRPSVAALEAVGIRTRVVERPGRSIISEGVRVTRARAAGRPYVMYARHDWPQVRQALLADVAASAPDVLYLDHLDSLVYADVAPAAAIAADLHNVYSLLAERAARDAHGVRRAYLAAEARLLERMERQCARRADTVMTVSDQEERYYRGLGAADVHMVPNGVDTRPYADLPAGRRDGAPLLLYIGAMGWPPNVSAARFLAETVLPQVRRAVPEARLRLVGRDPAPDVLELQRLPGVEVTGAVPDVKPHLEQAHLLAVPLEAGGGTRLKILEAFAAGLPVVSTPVGAEGIAGTDGVHLLVRERDRFADGVIEALTSPALGATIAANARQVAREVYDWEVVGARAVRAIESALSRRPQRPPA